MTAPPFDPARAHRWFAMECNNAAWSALESTARTADETDRMIHAAHAACHHWLQVGDALHHQRAQCLLATAYAAAGLGDPAVRHAEACLRLSESNGDAQTAFDRATALGAVAAAFRASGDQASAEQFERSAGELAASLDAEDRSVFEALYPGKRRAGFSPLTGDARSQA